MKRHYLQPWQARYNTIDDPLYFPRPDENLDELPWAKEGKKKVPDAACTDRGTPSFSIYIDSVNQAIKFRSYCCGWAVDFWPDGRNTCVNVYADLENSFIQSIAGSMEGLCGGQIGGSKADDWSTCGLPRTPLTPNEDSSMTAIEVSCHEGDHDSSGYPGGTRLDNVGN